MVLDSYTITELDSGELCLEQNNLSTILVHIHSMNLTTVVSVGSRITYFYWARCVVTLWNKCTL